jgi:hypothetical protein
MPEAVMTDVNEATLALFIGESFAEAFLRTSDSEKFHRWYIGKEGLRGGLQRFLQSQWPSTPPAAGSGKIRRAVVASRFLEKIFSYRLGGSVATVTTSGFESWPTLRQPPNSKQNQLSSAELVFSVNERCTAEGHIEVELADEAIDALVETLRIKQAKRVCIHFVNASRNPHNQERLRTRLLAENFEVFVPSSAATCEDEVGRWRKNILNASVSGTFEEVQAELNLALTPYLPEGASVSFLASHGSTFHAEPEHRLDSLWGGSYAWTQALRKKISGDFDVLYLGLDQFTMFYPTKTESFWHSPWGKIALPHVQSHALALQPTSGISVNDWGALDFSATPLGYEPGPMFMGRDQAPTLLDLFADDLNGLLAVEDRRSTAGMQKFKNQLWALNKTATEPVSSEEKLQPVLREWALQKLAADISLSARGSKVVCVGALAGLFFAPLKKRLPQLTLEMRAEAETASLLIEEFSHAR